VARRITREPAIPSPKTPAPPFTPADFQSALDEKEPEPQNTVKHRAAAIFTIFASIYKITFIFNYLEIAELRFPAKSLKLI